MKINGKVFVVTGAGGGIGSELVKQLLKKGAKVAAVDLRRESLEALQKTVDVSSGNLSLHPLNITDRKEVEALSEEVMNKLGVVDALINCAGIIQPFVKINDLEYDAIERVMNVNFYGTLYMTKAFLPHLLKRPEGYIANVSSMGGFLPVPGQSVYGASKAAVKLMTEGLYAELLNTNVHVSIIFPGATKTNISENSKVTTSAAAKKGAEKSNIPMLLPERAARLMIRGIEKNKPQIYTGSDSRMMNRLYRLNPVFATRLITKAMKSLLE